MANPRVLWQIRRSNTICSILFELQAQWLANFGEFWRIRGVPWERARDTTEPMRRRLASAFLYRRRMRVDGNNI